MTTKEDIRSRARVNATGKGELDGSFGNAGTGTNLEFSVGYDTGLDATNSMGSITADTKSCMPMASYEESYQFTASKSHEKAIGRMGSLSLSD